MIRFDRTAYSTVVYCSCGWREITVTRPAAWRIATEHERSVHPDSFQVRDAAVVRRRRAAAARDAGT